MGLDCYACHSLQDGELTPQELNTFEQADIHLCGGLASGDGSDGSFRGKVYATHIEEITGVSLYQEFIPPEVVKQMYISLQDCQPSAVIDALNHEGINFNHLTANDILELRKFFKVCAECNLGLAGWC